MSTPTHDPQTLAEHLNAEAERDEQELADIRDHVETTITDTLTDAVTGETQPHLEQWRDDIHDLSFQRYNDDTLDTLIEQLLERTEPWTNNPNHFASRDTWNEHGRRVPVDADAFEIHPDDEHPQTVYAYEQTTPHPDAHPDDVFEDLTTRVTDTANTDADEVYRALKTAAETGEFGIGRSIYVEEVGLETLGFFVDGVSNGRVYINQDHCRGEMFRTLAHEIAHELLHRDADTDRSPGLEIEADAVALAVVEYFGFTTTKLELYIAQWVRDLDAVDGDSSPADVISSDMVDAVTDTAAEIVKGVEDTR